MAKNHLFKKTVAVILTMVMVLLAAPVFAVGAFADDTVKTMYFGSYPQSKVTDEATLEKLNDLELTWTYYPYYKGTGSPSSSVVMERTDYMKYADVELDGAKYRAVYIENYRPYSTYSDYTSFGTPYQQSNGYNKETVYWFKYEPVEWQILDSKTGLMVTVNVIDSQAFSNIMTKKGDGEYHGESSLATFANDYINVGTIGTWLNSEFYNTAFSEADKASIVATEIAHLPWPGYEGYFGSSSTTTENVFLLSYYDMTNTAYGFSESANQTDSARIAVGTDYAVSQGLFKNRMNQNATYWLRTAGQYSNNACTVGNYGAIAGNSKGVCDTTTGVRPALCYKKADPCANGHTEVVDKAVAATCTATGLTEGKHCSVCNTVLVKQEVTAKIPHTEVVDKAVAATCTATGLTEGKHCSVCGEIITAQTVIPATGHADNNGDGTCDACGTDVGGGKQSGCSHMCHSTNKFVKFFWKIFNFFNKLFKIRQSCTCGAKHW